MAAMAASAILTAAYFSAGILPYILCGFVVCAAIASRRNASPLHMVDWAVLLVLVYELPSLMLSSYPANGVRLAKTLLAAELFYFLGRVAVRNRSHVPGVVGVGALGASALACSAVLPFGDRVALLHAAGFAEIVAFRARLVGTAESWVLGEWFTLLLLGMSFAAGVPAVLCACGRRVWAAGLVVVPLLVASGLFLSCSRSVFWALIVFAVAGAGTAAVYRVVRARTAAAVLAGGICALGLILAVENALYPGIAAAYTGQHTSQVRSTEGRLAIWKRSMEVFRRAPIWGVGSGNAPLYLTESADLEETTGFASRTFSLPIQILTEKGAVGAALHLAVLALVLRAAHRKLRNPVTTPPMKALTCCVVAGIAAVLFRELTYASLFEHAATAMLFSMMLALAVNEETA